MVTTAKPRACGGCLRRAYAISRLGAVGGAEVSGAEVLRRLQLDTETLIEVMLDRGEQKSFADHISAQSDKELRARVDAGDCWACCQHEAQYPQGLHALGAGQPAALICKGDPARLDDLRRPDGSVSVVGTRKATRYGREVAREIGYDLSSKGMNVVSGLSFGVDACAHRGALDPSDGGFTVAVVGSGPDVAYPAAHRGLWRRISEHGLVVSESLPEAGVSQWSLVARCRIIAALSGATVVVEAGEGSKELTVAAAAENCCRLVGAVPGEISSRASVGCNDLIAEGARLVRSADDLMLLISAVENHATQAGRERRVVG